MGYFNEILSWYFHAVEDAIREPDVVISDVEGGVDRSIPTQIVGDLGPTYVHRGHSGSGVHGENHPECSL